MDPVPKEINDELEQLVYLINDSDQALHRDSTTDDGIDEIDCQEEVESNLGYVSPPLIEDKESQLDMLNSTERTTDDQLNYIQEKFSAIIEQGTAAITYIRDSVFVNNNIMPKYVPLDTADKQAGDVFPQLKYDTIFASGQITSHTTPQQIYCSGVECTESDNECSPNQFGGCINFTPLKIDDDLEADVGSN